MNYSEKPSSVRIDRFKTSGKWYDTYAIDMEPYYDGLLIHQAVANAWLDRYWGEGTGLDDGYFFLVCLEPYHKNAHPVILRDDLVKVVYDERRVKVVYDERRK